MLKIIIRSQVIELCGFRNAVDDSACLRTLNGIVKHPVLFTDTECVECVKKIPERRNPALAETT